MRRFLLHSLVAIALVLPAKAQQWIQLPACGNSLPAGVNPSAAVIAVNPSGQLCTAGSSTVVLSTPLSINIPQVGAVVSGAYANGAVTSEGSTADGAVTGVNQAGSIISVLKGIFNNVITPISVSGSFAVSSPLGVNIAATTPINVTVSSPLNITGTVTSNPTGQNIVQLAGQQLASPTTYGVAPVGSVQAVNAFVTNNPSVTPPTPLQVTLPASPISVGIAGPTPLNVTIAASPLNVTAASPLNVTVSSPQSNNLVAVQGINIASPSTYGVAPVGSVQGINAFVTSLPATPLNVTVANQPTVVLSGSPVSVGIAGPTPLNVTVGGIVSPQNMTLVAIPGTPISITQGVTPLGRFLSLPPPGAVIGHTVTTAYGIINTGTQIGTIGAHQLVRVTCGLNAASGTTPQVAFLQIFDAASAVTSITLGTTLAKDIVPVAVVSTLSNFGIAGYTAEPPGGQFSTGMIVAFTTGARASGSVGVGLNCTFAYN